MKLFLLLACFFCLNVNSQIVKGIVKDSLTNEVLSYANIALVSKNIGTSTNQKGEYLFEIKGNSNDTLLVSSLGYATKYILLKDFNINKEYNLNISLLQEKQSIDEIVLIVKKTKYTKSKKLGVAKRKKYPSSVPFGTETCLLIKNTESKEGKLKELAFYLKENKTSIYEVLPVYYKIKFYNYDSLNDEPRELLSYENIIIKPKNKTQKIIVDLEGYNILFPLNGICVGIEAVNPKSIKSTKSMYTIAPILLKTHDKKALSWSSFRGKKWNKNNRISVFKRKMFVNPLINLEVKFKK